MMVTPVTPGASPDTPKPAVQNLGQADFIRLMTTQMKMQDPTDPVDNKEMIAQMAQFSSLSGITETNDTLKGIATKIGSISDGNNTLKAIADKLDAILAAQKAAGQVTTTAPAADTTATTN